MSSKKSKRRVILRGPAAEIDSDSAKACPVCRGVTQLEFEPLHKQWKWKCQNCGIRQDAPPPPAFQPEPKNRQYQPKAIQITEFRESKGQARPEQVEYLAYIKHCAVSETERQAVEQWCSQVKIPLIGLFDYALLRRWDEANTHYRRLSNQVVSEYGKRGSNERNKFLKDWRSLREHLSLVSRTFQKKAQSTISKKILGGMLVRFQQDIGRAYPIATDTNNPGKGLAICVEKEYGVSLRRPSTFNMQIEQAALCLGKTGLDIRTIVKVLDFIIQRYAPSSIRPLPSRFKETLSRQVEKAIQRNKSKDS